MATNKYQKSVFAGIRSYAELESSLQMIRRMEANSPLSRRVDRFVNGGGFTRRFADLALLAFRVAQHYLFKKKK